MNNDDETWITATILDPGVATSFDPGIRFLTDPDNPGRVWAVDRDGRIKYTFNQHLSYQKGKPQW